MDWTAPQKSNIDCKNGHILKESPVPNHHFGSPCSFSGMVASTTALTAVGLYASISNVSNGASPVTSKFTDDPWLSM